MDHRHADNPESGSNQFNIVSNQDMESLIGGYPDTGHAFDRVEIWKKEGDYYNPYSGYGEIIPIPSIKINIEFTGG